MQRIINNGISLVLLYVFRLLVLIFIYIIYYTIEDINLLKLLTDIKSQ